MKKIYLILLVLPLLLNSCLFNDEDKFTESSSERMAKTIDDIRLVLEGAQNGWSIGLYPNKTQEFGGYTLFVKFSDGNKLVVASELDKPDATVESMYDLVADNGPVLSFNTYNKFIHYFSEPMNINNIGPKDSGMGGDYEFMVLEATAERIKLMGKKTRNIVYMTPLPAREWTEVMTEYIGASKTFSTFSNYTYTVNGVTAQVKRNNYRKLTFTYPGEDDSVETTSVGIRYTPAGYEFYEPVKIGGVEVSFMNYISEDDSDIFVDAAGSGATLTVVYPSLNEVFVEGSWYFSLSQLAPVLQTEWKPVNTKAIKTKRSMYNAYFNNSSAGFRFIGGVLSGGTVYLATLQYSYTLIGEDEITLTCDMVTNGNWDKYSSAFDLNTLALFTGYEKGVGKTFKLSADHKKSPTLIKLTDKKDPTKYATLSKKPIAPLFEN